MDMQTRGRTNGTKAAWNAPDLAHFEKRLLDERKRVVAQMQQFGEDLRTNQGDADGEVASWRFHMADEGTDTFEREQSFLLASREGRLLWHIDDALRRLYKAPDRYGTCDECGSEIAYERLDALPYAKNCVSCKSTWEGGGRAD